MYTLVFSALWARGVIINPTVDDTFIPAAAGGVNLWLYLQAGTPPGQTHLQAILLGFLGCYSEWAWRLWNPHKVKPNSETEILGCSESMRGQVSSAWVLLKAEAAHHVGALSAGEVHLSSVFHEGDGEQC